MEEPAGGLSERFEHEDTREDGEGREVVGQILFGEADVLNANQTSVGDGFDPVDEVKFHASLLQIEGVSAIPSIN